MRFLKFTIFFLLCFIIACNKSSTTEPKVEYINNKDEYNDNIIVSTPEAFELFNIAISLTDYGIQNKNYVKKNSQYYENVQSSFGSMKSHSFIKNIEDLFNLYKQNSESALCNNLKEFSLYLQFQDDSLIVDNAFYNLQPDSIKYVVDQILINGNSFIKESNFVQFYQSNLGVYQDIADKFKSAIPAQSVWNWLENKFSIRYQKYLIPLSPLTGGSHFTVQHVFMEKTICMIVSGPTKYITTKVDEGNYTLFLFTEIDHNYVNPISDIHLDLINTAFADLDKWNNQDSYRSPYYTFNEYMTWAVFTLFAYDRYSENEFREINTNTVNNMVNNRKFIKFNEFNEELIRLYKNKEIYNSVEDLYPPILDWAKNQ